MLSFSMAIIRFVINFLGFSGDLTMTISPRPILPNSGDKRSAKTKSPDPDVFIVGSMLGPGEYVTSTRNVLVAYTQQTNLTNAIGALETSCTMLCHSLKFLILVTLHLHRVAVKVAEEQSADEGPGTPSRCAGRRKDELGLGTDRD